MRAYIYTVLLAGAFLLFWGALHDDVTVSVVGMALCVLSIVAETNLLTHYRKRDNHGF